MNTPWRLEWRDPVEFTDGWYNTVSWGTDGVHVEVGGKVGGNDVRYLCITVGAPRLRRPKVSRSRYPRTDGGGSKVSYGVCLNPGSVSWWCSHPHDFCRVWSRYGSPRYSPSSISLGGNPVPDLLTTLIPVGTLGYWQLIAHTLRSVSLSVCILWFTFSTTSQPLGSETPDLGISHPVLRYRLEIPNGTT